MANNRYLHQPLRLGVQTGFGINPFTPGLPAGYVKAGNPSGASGGYGWQSDPVDVRGQIRLSLEVQAIAAASQDCLYVPSTTAGYGLLVVACATGSSGLSLVINAPANSYLPASVASDVITLSPGSGMSNAALAYQTNNDPNAGSLIQLYPMGITFYGDSTYAPQDRGIDQAELDLIASAGLSQTALAGGAAIAAQNGEMILLGSNDPTKGYDPVALASKTIGATGPYTLAVNELAHRWVVAQFVPAVGSAGNIAATWFGRAAA